LGKVPFNINDLLYNIRYNGGRALVYCFHVAGAHFWVLYNVAPVNNYFSVSSMVVYPAICQSFKNDLADLFFSCIAPADRGSDLLHSAGEFQ
jgi:hypothetical protein